MIIKSHHSEIVYPILTAVSLFLASLIINYFAGTYATQIASNYVTDIILDNIPTIRVEGIFVYGIMLFFSIILGLLIYKPYHIPFVVKSISLFIIIRSFFVCLTHINIQPQAIVLPPGNIISLFTFPGDLFFSAHTGFPFLLMLIYWKNVYLRYIFLGFSLILGFSTLLGHIHYSIDVFAAFFITYSIYHIALWLFKNDYKYFEIK